MQLQFKQNSAKARAYEKLHWELITTSVPDKLLWIMQMMCVHIVVYENNWKQLSYQRIFFGDWMENFAIPSWVPRLMKKNSQIIFSSFSHVNSHKLSAVIGMCAVLCVSMGRHNGDWIWKLESSALSKGRELITKGCVWCMNKITIVPEIIFSSSSSSSGHRGDIFFSTIQKEDLLVKNDCAFFRFTRAACLDDFRTFEGDLQCNACEGSKRNWIYFQLRRNLILHIKRIPLAFHFIITFD